jgi:hypothetical protein
LDFFVGSDPEGQVGPITVARGDTPKGEHKFYVGLTKREVEAVVHAFKSVLIGHDELEDLPALLVALEEYKK